MEVHGSLLGYEKASQISGNKKPFAKSACVFFWFCESGTARYPLSQSFSFYKARLLAGFLFLRHGFFLSGRYRRVAGPESGFHVLKACRKNLRETIGAFDADQ
jgi:hypothetical protein